MDAPHRGDEFSNEGPSRLENNDELVRLFLRAFPPVSRFDGPVVGARGETSLDDDASDRPRGLEVRRGHVGHRMRNPSACHPISPPHFAIRVRNRNGFDGLLSGGPRVRNVTMPVVTMSETVAALRATVGKRGMAEEDLRALADYLMSFFGFETEAIHNWILRVERIKALAKPQRPKADVNAFAVYDSLPDDIWTRQLPAR